MKFEDNNNQSILNVILINLLIKIKNIKAKKLINSFSENYFISNFK